MTEAHPATETVDALTLAQLRRIDKAARVFVDAFDKEIIEEHGYQGEWNDLCQALFCATQENKP